MPFPKTEAELIAAGYTFEKQGRCQSPKCKAEIEWWRTPKGKAMPLDAGDLTPHWSTCPDAASFRGSK